MNGFTDQQKKELGEVLDEKFESFAQIVQEGFAQTATKEDLKGLQEEMHTEFGKVFERLDTLDDSVSYSRQSFSLVTRDLEDAKRRLTRVEEHLGISTR